MFDTAQRVVIDYRLCSSQQKVPLMTIYGQFCPIAKATEVLGERWTVLIMRELLMGTTRFSDFQRALSKISPTLLAKRLRSLEAHGLVVRKQLSGRQGHEYRLTPAGKELHPVVEALAIWGMRWARGRMEDDELDVDLLMWDIRRRLDISQLPDGETVLCFIFKEFETRKSWWFVINDGEVDVCNVDLNKDVDLYLTTDLRTLVEVWEGDRPLKQALRNEDILAVGTKGLIRSMPDWFPLCEFAHIRPADAPTEG